MKILRMEKSKLAKHLKNWKVEVKRNLEKLLIRLMILELGKGEKTSSEQNVCCDSGQCSTQPCKLRSGETLQMRSDGVKRRDRH